MIKIMGSTPYRSCVKRHARQISQRKTNIVLFAALFFSLLLSSCPSSPKTDPGGSPTELEPPGGQNNTQSVAEEIRLLTEKGTPSSLESALNLIRNRELANTEYGRVFTAIAVTLLKTIYPAKMIQLPTPDPPQTHLYSRILRNAEMQNYVPPVINSRDFLEWILPFLALYSDGSADKLAEALPDLLIAEGLNRNSVLAPLFLGIAYEKNQMIAEAETWYTRAWQLSSEECYPAALGLARIKENQGKPEEASRLLTDLLTDSPDNFEIKRQLAFAYYQNGEWSRAEPAIAEILQRDPRDREFILMRAHVLVELGQWQQAQAALDSYASISSSGRLYLFLRARVQAEGFRNRDSALNYLRSLIRTQTTLIDDDATVYAARLLLESSRTEDQTEGRDLLRRLLAGANPSLTVLSLALDDSIRREAWAEARPYMNRLLSDRRSVEDLIRAYTVERSQGNNAAALAFAREAYERDRANDEGIYNYVSALIATGRTSEASSLIENRLSSLPAGTQKSRYYYLRSLIRTNDDLILSDLRSSLFEDPRNLSALIAMFEYYDRRRDERRAVYYLRQAIAISPDNPLIQRYAQRYTDLL